MSWLTDLFRRSARAQRSLPAPQPPPGWRPANRYDGWLNIITGLNTERDKRSGTFFDLDIVTDLEARDLWLGNDMAKRIIEFYPKEQMRKAYRLKIATEKDSKMDPNDAKELSDKLARRSRQLRFNQAIKKAMMMRNGFGGCGLFPVIDGAQGDLSEPLDKNRIQKILAFHHFEPRELMPMSWYNSIEHPKFGTPETFMVMPIVTGGVPAPELAHVIHESRLIIFQGTKVSRLHQAGTRIGWGDNVLTPVREVLMDYGLSWGSAAALMQDFAQAVLKIDGLANLVATDQDQVARTRLQQIDLIRSAMRMVVIDMKDDFKREQTPISGLDAMLDRWNTRLSAAADMPTTALMGISPAGLNATGESDRAFLYDKVSQRQDDDEPMVEQGLDLLMHEIDGVFEGEPPELWSVEWLPLWAPDEKTQAQTRYFIAQADDLWIGNGTFTPEESAHSHFGGDEFSPDINLDWEAREQMKKLADQLPPALGGTGQSTPGVKPTLEDETAQSQAGGDSPDTHAQAQTGEPNRQPPNPNGSPFASANGARRVTVKQHDRSFTPRGGR